MALPVVFKYGTREQYDNLAAKNENALYFLTDTGEIYRGDVNLARGSHYEGEREYLVEDSRYETDNEVINRVLAAENMPAVRDDIFVIKTQIGESGKYSHTAFVYDGSNWGAMDGNYNAENVIFDQDFTVTENIGAFVIPDGQNNATLNAAGKNLKEVLMSLLAQELQPIRESAPAITVSIKANNTTTRSYEVGTSVTPSWTASLSAGSYTYGPATGVTAKTWTITDTKGNTASSDKGSFDAFVVADGENYTITAAVTHDDGAMPLTNLGNEIEDGDPDYKVRIKENSTAAKTSLAITGFRPYFYGAVNTKLIGADGKVDTSLIDSAMIRGLTNSDAAYNGAKDMFITAEADGSTKSFIVAYPSAANRSGVSKAEIQGSVAIAVTSAYKLAEATVEVEGKDGHTATKPYKVWVYSPAQIAAGEKHKITLA